MLPQILRIFMARVEIFMTLVEQAIDLNTADVKQKEKSLFGKQDT